MSRALQFCKQDEPASRPPSSTSAPADSSSSSTSSSNTTLDGTPRATRQRKPLGDDFWRLGKKIPLPPPLERVDSKGLVMAAICGNAIQCAMKFAVGMLSGSTAVMATGIHSLVDTLNQLVLYYGQTALRKPADASHQYGYGKEAYFWSLVAALALFWVGGVASVVNGFNAICLGTASVAATYEVVVVLGLSFFFDGWVLLLSVRQLLKTRPKNMPLIQHFRQLKDPFQRAVLLEDSVAILGVGVASIGLVLAKVTEMAFWDGLASMGVGGLLLYASVTLIRYNRDVLTGQSLPEDMVNDIITVVKDTAGVRAVMDCQSQWLGPNTFMLCVSVDFNHFYLASEIWPYYREVFVHLADTDVDKWKYLATYTEDVIRAMEKVVAQIEYNVRDQFPGAAYLEITPASRAQNLHLSNDLPADLLSRFDRSEVERMHAEVDYTDLIRTWAKAAGLKAPRSFDDSYTPIVPPDEFIPWTQFDHSQRPSAQCDHATTGWTSLSAVTGSESQEFSTQPAAADSASDQISGAGSKSSPHHQPGTSPESRSS